MKPIISEAMLAVVAAGSNGVPAVQRIPVPKPGPGEVLVRIAAAPINPSDIGFLNGGYGGDRAAARIPGFEGSGTVVAAGPGIFPRMLIGRRVACSAGTAGGSWAEYLVARASLCVPLPASLSFEQGAMMLVNPLTALALMSIARRKQHAAIVSTAAASAIGRMILRLSRRYRIPVINIVRRREQAELLAGLGADEILVSTDANFEARVSDSMTRLPATLILDAVGGRLAGLLLERAPAGATLLSYANLSGEQFAIDPRSSVIMQDKRIEGFFLGNWLRQRNILDTLKDIGTIRRLGATDLQSPVHARFPLAGVQDAIVLYQQAMTAGKVLLVSDPKQAPLA